MDNEDDNSTDTVIGLDVRGQMFYCNKTKLLDTNNGNSYFSARFREDSMLDAGLDRVDNEGRDIYVLDRDPNIFCHIMEYIDTAEKPESIGVYKKNKQLWGLVREEALYFGLDSLVELLQSFERGERRRRRNLTLTRSAWSDGEDDILEGRIKELVRNLGEVSEYHLLGLAYELRECPLELRELIIEYSPRGPKVITPEKLINRRNKAEIELINYYTYLFGSNDGVPELEKLNNGVKMLEQLIQDIQQNGKSITYSDYIDASDARGEEDESRHLED